MDRSHCFRPSEVGLQAGYADVPMPAQPSTSVPDGPFCSPVSDVVFRQRLRSASSHQLSVPRHRLSTYGRRAFSVAGPTVWNSLPDDLRDPERSTHFFRQSLKTFFVFTVVVCTAH